MSKSKRIKDLYSIYANRLGRNRLTYEEFQPLVLNIAYLEIALAKKRREFYNSRQIFIDYTNAAIEVIPEYEISDTYYTNLYIGFEATAEWDGLWNFLRNYFDSKLGLKIDNEERIVLKFDSSFHNRFENGQFVQSSETPRRIIIDLSKDMKNAQFSISYSLSNKEANLNTVKGSSYTYVGTDPDFMFEFVLDSFNNIESFKLTRTDRNLRIEYME